MTWTYSGDPAANSLDEVRFILGDTDENDPLLSDEEIQYLLKNNDSVQVTAAAACIRIIAKLTKEVDYQIGPEKVSANQKLNNYLRLRKLLGGTVTGSSRVPSIADPSGPNPVFDLGIHDVPGITGTGSGLDA